MNTILYVRHNETISLFAQHNQCKEIAKRYGFHIKERVFDYSGDLLHEAINKIISDNETTTLIIYSNDVVFNSSEDSLFYSIYLKKLGKQIITVK